MKKVSTQYKQAMAQKLRQHTYMVTSMGVISNEAQASARIVSKSLYLSDNTSIFQNREIETGYATFEENQVTANGLSLFPPSNDEIIQLPERVEAVSQDIKGSIKVAFDNAYDIKGITLDFGESYPTQFKIIINDDLEYLYSNDASFYTNEQVFNSAKTITIEPIHFNNGDNKRLRIKTMLMGIGIVFQNDSIRNASLSDECSFVSLELPSLDFKVDYIDKDNKFNVDDNNSFIYYLQEGQVINTTIGTELADKSVEWLNMPLTYLKSWSSNGRIFSITAKNRFSLMEKKYDEGYYIHSRTAFAAAQTIFEYLGFERDEYQIDNVLKNVMLVNPMPVVSCAECLQLIANAGRCALKQNDDGMICLIPNFENIVEPTDIQVSTDKNSYWSNPTVVRTGSNIVYADFTRNFVSADGSMYFLPQPNEEIQESGFVSQEISNDNGTFSTNPTLSMTLPATYTYYGIDLTFAGNPPEEMIINTYNDGELVDAVNVTNITNEFYFNYAFTDFDRMEFVFTKTYPRNRIILQKVAFGSLSDYRLTKTEMKDNPKGAIESKIQAVRVKIFTYIEETQSDETVLKEVEDENYYTYTLSPVGEVITLKNPLISTREHAQQVAEWMANYYANNVTYKVDYRGEPRLESLDYIYMDSDIINNLQVEIEKHTLNFDGALSGSLNLRRAINMINQE